MARHHASAWGILVAFGVLGCSALTDVEVSDVVQPPSLNNPAGAQALRAGAITRFTDAFVGLTGGGQVGASGVMADEFTSTGPNDADRRTLLDPSASFLHGALQLARVALTDAARAMKQFSPTPRAHTGQLHALLGFTELFLGENMCSGIPLSAVDNGQPVFGEPLTTTQLFQRAVSDFDSALVYGVDSARITNLARVGQARALLSLGDVGAAAAVVAPVPTAYAYLTEHSATVQVNGVFFQINQSRFFSVSDREGINGLAYRTASDPRVQTQQVGVGPDGVTPVFGLVKYNSITSRVVLASGIEARLIEAEAAYHANPDDTAPTGAGWLGILNALRATAIAPALPALTDPGSRAARVDLIFRERAFWLFGTGHRHGDLRRLVRQYARDREGVFPTGPYRGGLTYGAEVTYTPTTAERSNPNYRNCLNRDP